MDCDLARHFHFNPIRNVSRHFLVTCVPCLQESLVDMLACQWERVYQGREDVTARELANMEEKFLQRYVETDRVKVRELLDRIVQGENHSIVDF